MAIPGLPQIPTTVTKSLICVDNLTDAHCSGTVHNPFLPSPMPFRSAMEMLWILEDFFDTMAFPQAYCEERTFGEPRFRWQKKSPQDVRRCMDDGVLEARVGKAATFLVQVKYRQHATWQGTVTWNEQKKTRNFRSVLELLKLMDSVRPLL